jgi:hypothetical protein
MNFMTAAEESAASAGWQDRWLDFAGPARQKQ